MCGGLRLSDDTSSGSGCFPGPTPFVDEEPFAEPGVWHRESKEICLCADGLEVELAL